MRDLIIVAAIGVFVGFGLGFWAAGMCAAAKRGEWRG